MTHVIAWRATMTGATGHGTTAFPLAEAQRLCVCLNREYPDLVHRPLPAHLAPDPVAARVAATGAVVVAARKLVACWDAAAGSGARFSLVPLVEAIRDTLAELDRVTP